MNARNRRPLPVMQTSQDALALSEAQHDSFYLKAFAIQGWLNQLVTQAAAEYAERKNRRYRVMQTGQAQRGFLQAFGHVTGAEFNELLESLYRFTEYADPLAGILFRALLPLSIEHECSGDFTGPRVPDPAQRPREALTLLWRSLERWCDWVDAVVHLRIHARWHLAPEGFTPGPDLHRLASSGALPQLSAQTSDMHRAGGQDPRSEAAGNWTDTAQWQLFSRSTMPQALGLWPFQEVDETVISLWPLLKRHSWTHGDLLGVLGDLLGRPEAQPCQDEKVFAAYCANTLGLHKVGCGETAKARRPAGYEVALRLCPPFRQPTAPGEPSWFSENPNSCASQQGKSSSDPGTATGIQTATENPKPQFEPQPPSESLDFEV